MLSVLEEDRLSFLSFQTESECDLPYNSSDDEGREPDKNDEEKPELPSMLQLQIGDQVLVVSNTYGALLVDDDPDAMFAKIYDPNDEHYEKQMAIINKILEENPDFQFSDLDLNSDISLVGVDPPKDVAVAKNPEGFQNRQLGLMHRTVIHVSTISEKTERTENTTALDCASVMVDSRLNAVSIGVQTNPDVSSAMAIVEHGEGDTEVKARSEGQTDVAMETGGGRMSGSKMGFLAAKQGLDLTWSKAELTRWNKTN